MNVTSTQALVRYLQVAGHGGATSRGESGLAGRPRTCDLLDDATRHDNASDSAVVGASKR
jgi:hypothetical protein